MDISLASWLVIAAAIVLANLPFITEKVFGVLPLPARAPARAHAGGEGGAARADTKPRSKHFVLRLLELFVLYFVVGALAHALESRIGNAFAQTWEFYAITACMFLVLAFPGFIYRYLRKRAS